MNVDEFYDISESFNFWFIFIKVCLWFFSWIQLGFLFRDFCFKILMIFVMIIMWFFTLRVWSFWLMSVWCSEFMSNLHKTLWNVTSSCCSLIWFFKMQFSDQISCWLWTFNHMLWKSNHFFLRMKSCLFRSKMSMKMLSWCCLLIQKCSTIVWIIAESDLLSYFVMRAEVLRQIIVMLRNLMTSITQKILMKIRLFVLKSARIFNEILNLFLVIWHDKIKLFSSNNWWRLIEHRSISSTLSRKKIWSRVFLLFILLLDSAFAFSRIWV